jgi:hypothetical protein
LSHERLLPLNPYSKPEDLRIGGFRIGDMDRDELIVVVWDMYIQSLKDHDEMWDIIETYEGLAKSSDEDGR